MAKKRIRKPPDPRIGDVVDHLREAYLAARKNGPAYDDRPACALAPRQIRVLLAFIKWDTDCWEIIGETLRVGRDAPPSVSIRSAKELAEKFDEQNAYIKRLIGELLTRAPERTM